MHRVFYMAVHGCEFFLWVRDIWSSIEDKLYPKAENNVIFCLSVNISIITI